MYFRECPYCGCHLDPGESCDCRDLEQLWAEDVAAMTECDGKTRQYLFKWPEKEAV